MNWIVTWILAVVAFAAGFVLSGFFGEEVDSGRIGRGPETSATDAELSEEFSPRRSRDESKDDGALAEALRRIAELEAELRAREERNAEAANTIDEQRTEIEDLQEKLEDLAAGGPPRDNELDNGPAAVATILGLDSSRTQALETAWQRMDDERKRLEAQHANVEVDGDRMVISIPAHAEEWDAVISSFDDEVGRILTPAERDRYGELGLQRNLIDRPFGHADRTIEMGPHEHGFEVKETAKSEGSTTVNRGVTGGEGARQQALESYQHILDR